VKHCKKRVSKRYTNSRLLYLFFIYLIVHSHFQHIKNASFPQIIAIVYYLSQFTSKLPSRINETLGEWFCRFLFWFT